MLTLTIDGHDFTSAKVAYHISTIHDHYTFDSRFDANFMPKNDPAHIALFFNKFATDAKVDTSVPGFVTIEVYETMFDAFTITLKREKMTEIAEVRRENALLAQRVAALEAAILPLENLIDLIPALQDIAADSEIVSKEDMRDIGRPDPVRFLLEIKDILDGSILVEENDRTWMRHVGATKLLAKPLYDLYRQYCEYNGISPIISNVKFGTVAKRHSDTKHTRKGRVYDLSTIRA